MLPGFPITRSGFAKYGIQVSMEIARTSQTQPAFDEASFGTQMEVLRPLLRGYILSIFPQRDFCEDIIQETMLYAWEQRASFQQGTNFKAWMFKVAYFRTLARRRDLQRDKVGTFSEEFLQRVAGAAEELLETGESRLQALRECLGEVKEADLRLLRWKYLEGASLAERARSENIDPNRFQKAISRLRLSLRHCIEAKLSQAP
jgi:RNA polymerase sigma-70 factor (ECF subfamily)